MNKLDIVLYPSDVLRQKCTQIVEMTDKLDSLIDEMIYTMHEASGIGLAAPQVNIKKRLIVVDVSKERSDTHVLLNPKIIKSSGEIQWEEGCLSIPGVYATITRPQNIIVQAMNRDGKMIEMEANDLLAVCIQHEIDHINGKLFIDYLSGLKRTRLIQQFKKHLKDKQNT